MNGGTTSNRRWIARVRELRNATVRARDGVCYVEGIRQVVTALEAGLRLEAVLLDPQRLRSAVAHDAVEQYANAIEHRVSLSSAEFGRISARDNPVGIAAIVRWKPVALEDLTPVASGLYLVADDVRDPGNLGTLIRSTDAAGGAAAIVRGGTDPTHPAALRASLGTTFELPVAVVNSTDDVFAWAQRHGVVTVATSAQGSVDLWTLDARRPLAVLVGNEGEGLPEAVARRCDALVRIPMYGTATSLNVSVAAGIVLYELARRTRS